MSWAEFVEMALGLLSIPKSEFRIMTLREVFYKYTAHRSEMIREESRLRQLCMYLVAPHWDRKKNGPLKWPWQLWKIPEIDEEQLKSIKFTKVTKVGKN